MLSYTSDVLVGYLIKPLFEYFKFIFMIQLVAILLPQGPFASVIILFWCSTYKYFKPDYATALVNGYKRPIIGLHLCWGCTRLRYWPKRYRMWHHGDFEALKAAASGSCWLCRAVYADLLQSQVHRDERPERTEPEVLPKDRVLVWFAERTKTRSGFLDHLRGQGYLAYVYGPHLRELNKDPSSDVTFSLIKEWIEKCDTHHKCYQGYKAALPTRVIDISQDDPSLLITDGQTLPYVTLSHVWGGEQPLVTTTATLKERIKKIPMDTLPPLYRDAVTVTRRLGINYLWIDSLCILQDSQDDWSRESSKMGDIYRLSYLTLSALSSENCHQPMLMQRESSSSNAPDYLQNKPCKLRSRAEVFEAAPLCHRAWALQERLLSSRILFYSSTELFWECLTCTAREGSFRITPNTLSSYRYEKYYCPQVKIPLVTPLGENPSYPVSLPSDWWIIVSEYTRCLLTRRSDKLPALSGLASIFQRNTRFSYIAGLWEEDLVNGLLWYCPPSQDNSSLFETQTAPYRGPSWSWVSTDLAIQYKPLGNHSMPEDFKFISSEVELAGPDPMGEIVFATVNVRVSIYQVSYEIQDDQRNCFIYDSGEDKFGKGILDAMYEEPGVKKQCAAIVVTRIPHKLFRTAVYTTYFLIVVPVPNPTKAERWKRIGLAWTPRTIPPAPELSLIQLV